MNNYEENEENRQPLKRRVFDLPKQEGDLEDYLNILYEHQKNCEQNGNYIEAEFTKSRREKLKKDVEAKSKVDLKEKHKSEKIGIENSHLEEFKEFNDFWDKKMQGYDDEAQKVEQQMIQKYEEDLHLFEEEIEKMIPLKNKDSATLLNLKKIEEKLAKQEKYMEAHKAQQQRIKLEREESEKWNVERNQKIKLQIEQFKKKKETEINSLRQRIKSGQEEQKKARQIELERLLHKYQNAAKELELQQGNEEKLLIKTIKIPSSVGLSKYYGSRFQSASIDKREKSYNEDEN